MLPSVSDMMEHYKNLLQLNQIICYYSSFNIIEIVNAQRVT